MAGVAFAAQTTYNDIASLCDAGDPTNGGFWNVQARGRVTVSYETGSYDGTLDAKTTMSEEGSMDSIESRFRSDRESNAIPLTSEKRQPTLIIIR